MIKKITFIAKRPTKDTLWYHETDLEKTDLWKTRFEFIGNSFPGGKSWELGLRSAVEYPDELTMISTLCFLTHESIAEYDRITGGWLDTSYESLEDHGKYNTEVNVNYEMITEVFLPEYKKTIKRNSK
jgi:hypothetical protein